MKLPGIVTNVTAFGAFVDIGVHQDGLVHVSQLADRFVKDPAEVVKVQQKVTVTVLEVDLPRRRIALSMKTGAQSAQPRRDRKPPVAGRQPAARPPGTAAQPPRSRVRREPVLQRVRRRVRQENEGVGRRPRTRPRLSTAPTPALGAWSHLTVRWVVGRDALVTERGW